MKRVAGPILAASLLLAVAAARPQTPEHSPDAQTPAIVAGQTWTALEASRIYEDTGELFAGNAEAARMQVRTRSGRYHKNFVFPDGELIEISYETSRDLERTGAAAAARHLYETAHACSRLSSLFGTADLDAAIDALRSGEIRVSPDTDFESMIRRLERDRARCQGVTPSMEREAFERMREMAADGNRAMQIAVANVLQAEEPKLAEKYFSAGWEEGGSLVALSGLARLYGERQRTSDEVVRALAYAYAEFAVWTALLDGLPNGMRSVTHRLRRTDRAFSSAAPHVAEDAMAMAKKIITSNANCCRAE